MKKRFFAVLCLVVLLCSSIPADAKKTCNHPRPVSGTENVTSEATCTRKGVMFATCEKCGDKNVRFSIPKDPKNHKEKYQGCRKKKICEWCGEEVGAVVQHDVRKATCEYIGYCRYKTCNYTEPKNPRNHERDNLQFKGRENKNGKQFKHYWCKGCKNDVYIEEKVPIYEQ